jgi:hypothetical protein
MPGWRKGRRCRLKNGAAAASGVWGRRSAGSNPAPGTVIPTGGAARPGGASQEPALGVFTGSGPPAIPVPRFQRGRRCSPLSRISSVIQTPVSWRAGGTTTCSLPPATLMSPRASAPRPPGLCARRVLSVWTASCGRSSMASPGSGAGPPPSSAKGSGSVRVGPGLRAHPGRTGSLFPAVAVEPSRPFSGTAGRGRNARPAVPHTTRSSAPAAPPRWPSVTAPPTAIGFISGSASRLARHAGSAGACAPGAGGRRAAPGLLIRCPPRPGPRPRRRLARYPCRWTGARVPSRRRAGPRGVS